ncbi:LLM class flavin-dependent oxidoreductase [Nocardioides immobilis]|uniref:LLM class flavin-dependent oxidoreductase n=1 Tax=Nocardioides immobilis TaxID=2049295 RepID=A0A417Y7X5_9ACTN|nr:LLM class flavin-dependent oxidoreductase [Nocardioides immobilis]RHW28587.1 LLM class flavin-dependent oxidoreductase [Nocardioides immobilis]
MTAQTHRSGSVVRFGVFIPQLKTDVPTMLEQARTAEAAGFHSFWVMDHLLAPGAPPSDTLESWTLLTALAGATTTLRFGHLVGCAPFRHPSLLAKMAATFDQISGGRLELGLGWGSVESELTAFGFEPGSRRQRSESLGETLQILNLMFTGDTFDFDGRYFQLQGAYGLPRPVQPRIPVHIGGGGRQLTMPLVAAHADWWNCIGSARDRLEELAPMRGSARISAQYAVGLVHREEDRDAVADRVARRMPESAWGRPLVGTPDELVELFRAERSRGVALCVVRFDDFGTPETLRRFGAEVIPALD